MKNENYSIVLGTGPLGLSVAARLAGRGDEPILVSRSGGPAPKGARQIIGDIRDPGLARRLPTGATVYHCANALYHRWSAELPGLWESVGNLTESLGASLVAGTNLYAFGRPRGPMNAESSKNPHTRKGRVRHQVEEALMRKHREGRFPASLVRCTDFFGPGVRDSALGNRFFAPLVRGQNPVFTGRIDQPHSYALIADFAKTMIAVGDSGAWGGEWIVPTDEALTGVEMTKVLTGILERPLKARAMGRAALGIGGLFIPAAREVWEMLYEFEEPFVSDGSATTGELGVHPTPFIVALTDTVAWYRGDGSDGHKIAEAKAS